MDTFKDLMLKARSTLRGLTMGGAHIGAAVPGDRRRMEVLNLEALESRCLLSTASPAVYAFDGTGNNRDHPEWGSTGEDLLRTAPAAYADGFSTLAGPNRPGARLISDVIVSDATDGGIHNDRFLSDWVYAWGQFIDHDLDLTTGGTGTQLQAANIPVPKGDPFFDPTGTGTQVIPLNRSEFDPKTGTKLGNPRQQINDVTAWLDGSMIYGSDAARADALRAHTGGLLLTSAGNLLPFNTMGLTNANEGPTPNDQLFVAGDVRANENIELTAVHTLFLREHNRLAGLIQKANPSLGDEAIYQAARAIVIAELQSITFNEFLPALLGPNAIQPYQGYNSRVNPGVANEFSTAAFRIGHSLLAPDVEFMNPDGTTMFEEISLAESFFNPNLVVQTGVDPILKYLATDNAQEVDNMIVPELQNFLFGNPGEGGFDLASLNIQRGRDHGLADYNTTRAAYGLPRVTSFAQITSNLTVQTQLKKLYGNVNNIDLWVGGLAEDHVAGSSVGPLFQRIIANQFTRIRAGDRLWFENQYSGTALNILKHTTLTQIITRNTVNNDLQANIFFFKLAITGTVFNDANRNGARDRGEAGVGGRKIQLIDDAGEVVAQTTTASNGFYRFDNLGSELEPAAAYTVREVLPFGVKQTTANPPPITFSRGETFSSVDFGNYVGSWRVTLSNSATTTSSWSASADATSTGALDELQGADIVAALAPSLAKKFAGVV